MKKILLILLLSISYSSSFSQESILPEDSLSSNEIIIDSDLIFSKDDDHDTYEYWSQTQNYLKIEQFINNGTDINSNIYEGNNLLLLSIGQKNINKVILSLKYNSNYKHKNKNKNNVFHILFENFNLDIFNLITNNLSKKDIKFLLNEKNIYGETPLHSYTKNYHLDDNLLNWFYINGFDFNTKNLNGQTPLHYTATNGNCLYSNLLIGYGAKTNILDNDNQSIYNYASRFCSLKYMSLIE